MTDTPIVLVPGFWLGGWAWRDVAETLRSAGHTVTAMTLPGLSAPEVDRSSITLEDHVAAICAEVASFDRPVLLAVHSGAGGAGYAVTDRIPERIAAMVYVDSGPATGAINPDLTGSELPLPQPDELAAQENLDGLSAEQLATFRELAVPEPAGAVREAPSLSNPARLSVPSTVICTGFPSEQVIAAVAEGYPWVGGLAELLDVTYVDLPTSHWPMWSRPIELAAIIERIAQAVVTPA